MKPISQTDPRISEVAAQCSAVKNGMSAADLAKARGISAELTQRILAHARKQGKLILYKLPPMGWRWMSPEDHAEVIQTAAGKRLERRRARQIRIYHQARKSGQIDSYNRITDPPEWPIQRRYVRAGDDPPPATKAVNSVFALGQR